MVIFKKEILPTPLKTSVHLNVLIDWNNFLIEYALPFLTFREERRAKHTVDRKQKKENMLGARRGLVMA